MSYFKAKMHQILYQLGLHSRPRWRSLQHSSSPLAGFWGSYFSGKKKGNGERGRERTEGKGRKWGEEEGRGEWDKKGNGKKEREKRGGRPNWGKVAFWRLGAWTPMDPICTWYLWYSMRRVQSVVLRWTRHRCPVAAAAAAAEWWLGWTQQQWTEMLLLLLLLGSAMISRWTRMLLVLMTCARTSGCIVIINIIIISSSSSTFSIWWTRSSQVEPPCLPGTTSLSDSLALFSSVTRLSANWTERNWIQPMKSL